MQVSEMVHVPMQACVNEFYDFKQPSDHFEKTLESLCEQYDPLDCKEEVTSEVDVEPTVILNIKTESFDGTESTEGKLDSWKRPSTSNNDGSEIEAKIKNEEIDDDRPFPCAFCRKRFTAKQYAWIHASSCRLKPSKRDEPFKLLRCEICDKPFVFRYNLELHLLEHGEKLPDPCKDASATRTSPSEQSAQQNACGEFEVPLDKSKCLPISDDKVNANLQAKSTKTTLSTPTAKEKLPDSCEDASATRTSPSEQLVQQNACSEREVPIDKSNCPPISDDKVNADVQRSDNEQLTCDVCDKEFWFPSELSKHRSTQSCGRLFKCARCSKTFKTRKEQLAHDKDQERQCDGCDLSFDSPDDMLEHRNAVHPDLEPYKCKEAKCRICAKTFKTSSKMKSHIRKLHGDSLHRCEECNLFYFTEKELLRHNREHNADGNYLCATCDSSFASLPELMNHRRLRHLKRLHSCQQCGATFANVTALHRHREKHKQGAQQFVCETCGKTYKYKRALSVHIEENHAAKPKVYECKVCDKRYKVLASFMNHMLLHRDKGSEYECGVCKKQFEVKVRFDQHMRIHNRRHGCDLCDMRFLSPAKLARHKLCHAREAAKPYSCKLCTKRFSTTAAVSQHVKTMHDGKKHLKCDVCGMEFYNRFHYAGHYSQHNGIKPYQCDICGKGYNYNQCFIIHRKRCAPQQAKVQNNEPEVTLTSAS